MKKIEQAGSDATSTPGKTSVTGSNVWARTVKNTPVNESPIQGMTFTREEMEHEHKTNLAAIPYETFERVMVQHGGAILVEEGA